MFADEHPFHFGTKAETLDRLSAFLSKSVIPALHYFAVADWREDRDGVLGRIARRFAGSRLVVRSSAVSEDGVATAMAGAHMSVLDVLADDRPSLAEAIERVEESYARSRSRRDDADQILVQSLVSDVSMSGVVFTQDMNTGAPYYVINYDDESGRTDTVTAGGQYSNRTLFVHRQAVGDLASSRFASLLAAIREVEDVTGSESLDVEFAVGRDLTVHLLQVRRITTHPNWNRGISIRVSDAIDRLRRFVAERSRPLPGVHGTRSILGQMPDWNPAEMIGTAPRPLALSLYRRLITDSTWRIARREMGYAEPLGAPLMASLGGQPYVDVRLSFHSLLPADLAPEISGKLVDAWLARLGAHRELHDKVEFEVGITCLTPEFEDVLDERYPGLLSERERTEFRRSLFRLTDDLLRGRRASLDEQLDRVSTLERSRASILERSRRSELFVASALLEECVRLGTIPFAIVARHAFVARSFLKSFVGTGALTEEEVLAFLRSVRTVASGLVDDLDLLHAGELTVRDFLVRYGHLRPGTYDILSLRYDRRADLIEGLVQQPRHARPEVSYEPSAAQRAAIREGLSSIGLRVEAAEFLEYARRAIAARESAKFVFTRNVSDALEIVAAWGQRVGLSREELSYLTIDQILDSGVASDGRTLEQELRDRSVEGRRRHELTLSLRLPHLIESPEDVAIVPLVLSRPNFITQRKIRGGYVQLEGHDGQPGDLAGRIVLIEGADPGYDWIFTCPLLGLVTKYGGANSHMAIRCAEFGLPAAIGVGEQIYDRILRARTIEIDCAEGRIVPVGG